MDSFLDEDKSDVIFIVENERIPAIKSYLAQKSYVFQSMFTGPYQESNQREIQIPDLNANAFKEMVRFLYLGCNDTFVSNAKDYRSAIELYRCAHKYALGSLMETASSKLIQCIDVNNFIDIYDFAKLYEETEVISCLVSYMRYNTDLFLNLDQEKVAKVNELTENRLLFELINEQRTMKQRIEAMNKRIANCSCSR